MVQFNRSHKIAGVIVAIIGLSYLGLNVYITTQLKNVMNGQGFSTDGEVFKKSIGQHLIEVRREHPHRNNSRIQHRNSNEEHNGTYFFVDIITTTKTANLPSLFCSQIEYESNQKLGSWYPTSAVVLANGYAVGKCFPKDIVKRVLALPTKSFKMDSYLEMKLYLPKLVAPNTYYKRVRFLSDDATELSNELALFLPYYEIQLGL